MKKKQKKSTKEPRKKKKYGSDFTKVKQHIIQNEEYEDAPMLTDEALNRGIFFCTKSLKEVARHVPQIRAKTSMTQKQFAKTFGFPLNTLRKWEQGIRIPNDAAMALLTIIDRNPQAAIDALHPQP